MYIQPVKSTLISWKICLGLAPLPDKVIEELERLKAERESVPTKHKRSGVKVIMTEFEESYAMEVMTPFIKSGSSNIDIYKNLISLDALPKNEDGNIPSFEKIVSLAARVRKELGITRFKGNTCKVAYEMHEEGRSYEEIARKIKVKIRSIPTLLSAHRKKLGLSRKSPAVSTGEQALFMREEGFTYEQIAEKLDMKASSVRSNISRHKKILIERY